MEELTLTTPSLLFSAVSLILLAYTNRFLAYAQVVRNLKENYRKEPSKIALDQIKNLKKRLYLTRAMQVLGISSLLLCVVCTFLIYIGLQTQPSIHSPWLYFYWSLLWPFQSKRY